MSEKESKTKSRSKFWWPDVSSPDEALSTAKFTQFIAYWIGGSYIVIGFIGGYNTLLILGIVISLLGIGIWKNFFWIVPIVSFIGILEAGLKVFELLSNTRIPFFAAFILLFSIHGLRAWLALRKQAKNL